jgi:CheY-like chemotaxis protein
MTGGGTVTIATRNVVDGTPTTLLDRAGRARGCPGRCLTRARECRPTFAIASSSRSSRRRIPAKGPALDCRQVYGIVNQSGGTIAVESAVGQGTTFTITLPAAGVMAASVPREEENIEMSRGHETILIVEDAEDVRILARRSLEELGYTVLVARNAADALEISAAGSIEVLLTDIVMPHTSGPQLVAKYLAERPAPIVIYMSGYADDALARYELDPAIVFLRKPFTPSVLARTVREALDAANRASLTSDAGANSAAD